MPTIHITSFIAAPLERVFDLSRNISLHKVSMQQTKDVAVRGITAGLINKDESVTWKGKHLFKTRVFTIKVTEMKPHEMFIEKIVRGAFKYFQHEHYFKQAENGTIIIDIINFETPYGWLGRTIDRIYLRGYLENMIAHRNDTVRQYAVSDKWRALLHHR